MNVVAVEMTPNPSARKFVLDETILDAGSRHYDHPPLESEDLLAARIFGLTGVVSVFFMGNFITVDKTEDVTWEAVRDVVQAAVAEGARPGAGADLNHDPVFDDAAMLAKINQILDSMVRPALAGDGGGLKVVGMRGYDLYIHYQGACGSCPSSTAGTMYAIQNLLREEVNEEINVLAA